MYSLYLLSQSHVKFSESEEKKGLEIILDAILILLNVFPTGHFLKNVAYFFEDTWNRLEESVSKKTISNLDKAISKLWKLETGSKSTVKGKVNSETKSKLKTIDKLDPFNQPLIDELAINTEYTSAINQLMETYKPWFEIHDQLDQRLSSSAKWERAFSRMYKIER